MRQISSVKGDLKGKEADVKSWQPPLTAAVGWVHPPRKGDWGGALPASATGTFSHLEESAFHLGGLIQGWIPMLGERWATWGSQCSAWNYAVL